jgi:xylulokinase
MFLGLDLGTGSIKALVISENGTAIASASATYNVNAPQAGWAESNPEDWWNAVVFAVQKLEVARDQITAIGLSGQMHSLVLCDAAGRALRPAILWADGRSAAQLEVYRALPKTLRDALRNPLVTGMMGVSLLWLKEHEPALFERATVALQPKDWLRFQLTGNAFTDPSDASATLLYDLERDRYSQELLVSLGLRSSLFAPCHASGAIAGELTRAAAKGLGLRAGIPVATGAGDTAAAILGSGLRGENTAQLTVGTGAQLVTPRTTLPPERADPKTHLFRSANRHGWYAMSAIQNAGLALEGARRMLGLEWVEAYELAFGAGVSSDGAYFLPYLSGERTPHLDPKVRGGWLGLGLQHSRSHLMRAAFEGVAFSIRAGLEALEETGLRLSELRLAGGGTLDGRWRQLLSDTLSQPLHAVEVSDASARGATLLGAIACGAITESEALGALAPLSTLVATPNAEQSAVISEHYARFAELYPRLQGWSNAPSASPNQPRITPETSPHKENRRK